MTEATEAQKIQSKVKDLKQGKSIYDLQPFVLEAIMDLLVLLVDKNSNDLTDSTTDKLKSKCQSRK